MKNSLKEEPKRSSKEMMKNDKNKKMKKKVMVRR